MNLIYSTYRPSVTQAFDEYRKARGKDEVTRNVAWLKFANECEKFHLKPLEEYDRQLNLIR